MGNLLRFLVFVAVVACAVGVLYLWKTTAAPSPLAVPVPQKNLSTLAESDREFTTLVGNVLPSVVSIEAISASGADPRAELMRRMFGEGPGVQPRSQLGSGAIVSKDGYIVTNWHVLENAAAATVHLNDGRSLPAKFVGGDRIADVAVLKIDGGDLQPLAFADSDEVRIGQMVIAVGNPFGLQESVTRGIVSGKGRKVSEDSKEFFQTDAPINPGNSGGPLVDINGRIIALNNFILQNADGLGFAIPSNTVRRVFENIRQYGHVIRPWFGVIMARMTPAVAAQLGLPDSKGALVEATMDKSPAARDGIRPGDVILSFNNRPVTDWKDLRDRVAEAEPGHRVPVEILRDGHRTHLEVTIEKQPGE